MLPIQKYLQENGLEKLKEEFQICVSDYPDFVVLNYDQIFSPRFNPIVDSCRSLILRKSDWKVLSRSFDRFYNYQESVDQARHTNMNPNIQRISSLDEYESREFDITKAIIEEKLDGSIISVWFDGTKWQTSTRKLAYAEGQTALGRTFHEIFMDAVKNTDLFPMLNTVDQTTYLQNLTFVFELTGPENRVVTPYRENKVYLIGVRNNENGSEYNAQALDTIAEIIHVGRPKYFKVSSYEELIKLVKSFPAMDEGVVLKIENENGSHWRIKLKNPAYLAISNLRANGQITPKRVLNLVMSNDHIEYLGYFPEDQKYFDFTESLYVEVKERIKSIFRDHMAIKDQKEFALAIMPKTVYGFEQGVIFNLRKKGGTVEDHLNNVGSEKIAKSMNLKQKFIDKFHIIVEDDDVV